MGLNALGCRVDMLGNLRRLAECCFTSTETVALLGTGRRGYEGGGMDFHTAPELWTSLLALLSPSGQSARVARAYLL